MKNLLTKKNVLLALGGLAVTAGAMAFANRSSLVTHVVNEAQAGLAETLVDVATTTAKAATKVKNA
jgi:hypothetical protein